MFEYDNFIVCTAVYSSGDTPYLFENQYAGQQYENYFRKELIVVCENYRLLSKKYGILDHNAAKCYENVVFSQADI